MEIYYINSIGERLDLTSPPYRAQTGDILDYAWERSTNNYGKITGFTKGVQEKSITLTVTARTREEYHAAIDQLHEVAEYDVVTGSPGRLYVNDSYLTCYITASAKTEWEDMEGSLDNTITIATDYPWWIKEETFSFRGDSVSVEEFTVAGRTDISTGYSFKSVAENGYLQLGVMLENGGMQEYSVRTKTLRGLENYKDIFYKTDHWVVKRAVWEDIIYLSDFQAVIENEFITLQKDMDYASNGVIVCDGIPSNTELLSYDEISEYSRMEGDAILNTQTREGYIAVELRGTKEGVEAFSLISTASADYDTKTYQYLEQKFYSDLGKHNYYELENGIDEFVVRIEPGKVMTEKDYISKDVDGVWKLFSQDDEGKQEKSSLSNEVQKGLNNIPSYQGQTFLYTKTLNDTHPIIQARFYPMGYKQNLLPDGTVLRYPQKQFIAAEGGKLYIRLIKESYPAYASRAFQMLYALETPFYEQIPEAGEEVMEQIEELENLKSIFVIDPVYGDQTNRAEDGAYPSGYPKGYAGNLTEKELYNEAIVSSPFQLRIFGKSQNPEIRIGGHTYKVLDSIGRNEFVTIDSRTKEIKKHTTDGETVNIFAKRYKEESVFYPIPAGKVPVYWDRAFGFDLTLYQERSEPSWS